jgi:hypothetical protein
MFLLLLLLLLLQQRQEEELLYLVASRTQGGSAGGASFRRANAAQVCNNVGLLVVDSDFECSFSTAARQIVSEKWREGGGL